MSDEVVKERRRLVDIQYYAFKDEILVHEIVNGERTYTQIKKPKYTFGVLKPEFPANRKDFFSPSENIEFHTGVSFGNRHKEIAKVLGYNMDEVNRLRGDPLKDFKKSIMTNERLHFADNSVTFQTSLDYQDYYKDVIDNTLQLKVLSFDIEVHSDFHNAMYKVLTWAARLSTLEELESFKMTDISSLNPVLDMGNVGEIRLDNLDRYGSIMNRIYDNDNTVTFKEVIAAIQSEHTTLEYLAIIQTFIILRLDGFYKNLGFPEQNKAANRIDAISAFDSIENTMYLYLLIVNEDIKPEFNNWITDAKSVNNELALVLDCYKVKIYLNALKGFVKGNNLIFKEFTDALEHFCITGEGKDTLEQFLVTLGTLTDLSSLKKITVKFKPFFDELTMIKKFFTDIREVIKPNFLLAHNVFFDIVTLHNRLYRFGENPSYWFSQFGYDGEEEDMYEVDFRIDFKAKNNKQNKSFAKVAGLVILDSMLLTAKTSQRERDFSLDACASDILKETKFKYDAKDITELFSSNLRQFLIYSSLDTFLVDGIDRKMGFIELFQTLLDDCSSCWSEYAMKSVFLTNVVKKELLQEYNLVTRNNLSSVLNANDNGEKFVGAFVTNLEKVKTFGLHSKSFDCDASSFYPSTIISNNVMTDKLLIKFEDKALYQNFLCSTKIEFANKYLNGRSPTSIMNSL